MSGFTKLSSSIITSSIWVESDTTLRVWIAMLATANANGIVEGAPPGMASLARVTLEACLEALKTLSSPDQYSRSPENEGRRIEVIPGGWLIVNYLKYREKDQEKPGSRAAYYRKYRSTKNGPEDGDCCELLRATDATGKVLQPQQEMLRDTQKQKAEGRRQKKSTEKTSVANAPVAYTEHNAFIEGWCESFEAQHGRKYIFQDGRDGKAVKTLLSRTDKPASELIGIATQAWSKLNGFLAGQAVTICGFATKINEIQDALANLSRSAGQTERPPRTSAAPPIGPWAPTETQKRFSGMFKRPDTRVWTHEEIEAYNAIGPVDDGELTKLEEFYEAEEYPNKPLNRRTSLLSLLRNYSAEADKANRHVPHCCL